MTRLSSPVQNIKDHYDVVVVGSGYGGAIAACRLARASRRVCLLERGREIRPGEYPDTLLEAAEETQVQLSESHIGDRTALFDFRIGHEISVLVGCGLGGTSLINANVALRPLPAVFEQPAWPAAIRSIAGQQGLDPYFRLAEEMLGSTPYPTSAPALRKLQAQERSAGALGRPLHRPPINVTFSTGMNAAGVPQGGCQLCGDCVSGCNYSAKNTTLMNYLPDAHHHRAEIFTQVAVRYVEPAPAGWLVHFEILEAGRELFGDQPLFVHANRVILAAGTLGSTEILLRSRDKGLPLSPLLGQRFTGNADFLGFAYDCDMAINGVGAGSHPMRGREPVGPCITSYIDLREGVPLTDGLIVEEGSIPGAAASLLPAAFGLAADVEGQPTHTGLWDRFKAQIRTLQSNLFGAYTGAVHNTQTYLVMGHDTDRGKLELVKDTLHLSWPGVGKSPIFATISQLLKRATEPLGGTYLKEPLWNHYTREQLITVHPLGGCVMADVASAGVVNDRGQVFRGDSGIDVHPGLYVMDGSILPTPLGVNPLLTICALAERCCELLVADGGWESDMSLPSVPIVDADARTVGVQFTESMTGYVSTNLVDDYEQAYAQGQAEGQSVSFVLTIAAQDLQTMLSDPQHQSQAIGTVTATLLSPETIFVHAGRFQLFVENQKHVGVRNMIYRLPLITQEGRRYFLSGYKVIRDDGLLNLWRDNTTLYTTVHDGPDEHSPVLARGILKIPLLYFAKQLATLKALGAHSIEERIAALGRFGAFFAGVLFETYGGVVSEALPFHPGAPRKKRPLRIGPPETHFFAAGDGCELRLLRYRGGERGPVLLSHGIGVSSQIFTTDTIDTNLVEFLAEQGFDVWLLDYRSSIALPTAAKPATCDDIARYDYPAAIAKIRELTGAPSLQVVAHGLGATTLLMSLLSEGGLPGVRSLVLMGSAADISVPTASELSAGLHLPDLLADLGVTQLSADPGPGWADRLFDRFTALQPEAIADHDRNPVSRRITFLYGKLYEPARLNAQTYDYGLDELFGPANLTLLEHLGMLVRAGHLVDARGGEVYMSRFADRLRLPITFLHGTDDRHYLPESSERTYQHLITQGGHERYGRHVLAGYGHIDPIIGQDAAREVYPLILAALTATT